MLVINLYLISVVLILFLFFMNRISLQCNLITKLYIKDIKVSYMLRMFSILTDDPFIKKKLVINQCQDIGYLNPCNVCIYVHKYEGICVI